MNVIAVVQARMGSVRFPNKVMQLIKGVPMIELLLDRLSMTPSIDKIILATSIDPRNRKLAKLVSKLGYELYQGSEDDVLDRYYQAAKVYEADVVVRITGDCPLIDPDVVETIIKSFDPSSLDYVSNVHPPTYPDGLDVEVFSFAALEKAWNEAVLPSEREHVTSYISESGRFRMLNLSHEKDYSAERWTVDEPDDLEVIKNVFNHFYPRRDFSWREVLELKNKHPELFTANQHLMRNEGVQLGKGQKLWKRAKKVIPGGNMLLSKRAEMFLPEQWPTYFSKAKGCKVWDLDGKEYIDVNIMGVGTNILGYGHPEVDAAVLRAVEQGNMSTFNCTEEVYLAEKLIELHPWAQMVRFARTGGEANAISIRIARAASGKDKVAICGYHGWHDWYLSANLADDKNLDGHLLTGLEPKGVPRNLRGTVYPFEYNDYDSLEKLVDEHDIGVIKMEVTRNEGPLDQFLEKVRHLATAKNIILIFDECTSGFRQSFGGLHKLHEVEPDMAIFGKALGNGYAITAVIGKQEIMEVAQSTFISSTFWTERIGPTAALKTLEIMELTRSWEKITQTGKDITSRWKLLAEKHDISIKTYGLPALTGFSFISPNALAYKTLIAQEMLAKGFLAGTNVYVCLEHTPEIISAYFENLEPIFEIIKECEEGQDVMNLLHGPVCHDGFRRLN
jgi:glutamate-1-semialdehyde 2,1-aminomutase